MATPRGTLGCVSFLETAEELDVFIGERLADAAVWRSARVSDGIGVMRTVEKSQSRARFCGQIWDIDQMLHTFWLDIESSNDDIDWTLYFDPIEDAPRRARNLVYALSRPDEVDWRVTLSGRLKVGQSE
jgi:hypothetical protein